MNPSPKFIVAIVCLVELTINVALAQKKLEGHLADKDSNQPVAFAHIGLTGNAKLGTISNDEGFFRLDGKEISDSDTLLITHLNYITLKLPIQAFLQQGNSSIQLTENIIRLSEIQVVSDEDYQAVEDVINQTKKSLHFPLTTNLYYREMVKENSAFNKFADGLITAVYEKDGDDNEVKIRVDQCRTAKLPKDEDDQFDLVSPVKLDRVLGYTFGNFFNKLIKDHRADYHYYAFPENPDTHERLLIVEPKKEADRSDDKLLFRATLKADQNNIIRDVQVEMDSLCHIEKSILGLKYGIKKSTIIFSFKETDGINYLAFAKVDFIMTFATKKFTQTENFISEFLTLDVKPDAKEISKSELFKKSVLYKHPNKYDTPFWKNLNLPVLTEEEERLILALEKAEKANEGSPQSRK